MFVLIFRGLRMLYLSIIALLLFVFFILCVVPSIVMGVTRVAEVGDLVGELIEFLRLKEKVLLTLEEANELTGVSATLLEKAIERGELKTVVVTRKYEDSDHEENIQLVSRQAVDGYTKKFIKCS